MSVPSLQKRWRSCPSSQCAAHWLQDTPLVRRQESRIVALCQWKRRNNVPLSQQEKHDEAVMLTGHITSNKKGKVA